MENIEQCKSFCLSLYAYWCIRMWSIIIVLCFKNLICRFRCSSVADDGDTDDWGWNEGDVELADKKGSPASFKTPPPSRGLSLKQRSPSMEKKQFTQSAQNYKKGMSLQQSSLQPPLQTQAPMIASLGTVQPVVKKVAPRKKPKEDDIFASMGLAAQPKFQAVRSPPPSGGAPISGSSWGGLSAGGADSAGAAAAWDGDDDLDDLFDD